jgi:endoglucanase
MGLARLIAEQEVVQVPGLGTTLLSAPTGFQHGGTYHLNATYIPLQIILGLSHFVPDGPWEKVATSVLIVVSESAPHGFVSD